jgi:glycosyltransferase involved in cell wall biosynthesis
MLGDIKQKYPLVSVGVASYNNSKYVIDTLNSITSQSYGNIELIIVDDCSKDDSVEIIHEFLKTVSVPYKFHVNERNKGVVYVCNKLLSMLGGDYYTLIGSDDIMLPDRIEKQLAVMTSEDADMVFGRLQIINEAGVLIEHYKNHECVSEMTTKITLTYRDLLIDNIVTAPTVMLKTKTIRSINGYDNRYNIEDLPLWVSIATHKFKMVYMNEVLVKYRVLPNSLNTKITTPLAHFSLINNSISKLKFLDKSLVRIFWIFRLTGEKEFKNAYKHCSKGTAIYWYSIFNRSKIVHAFFYRILKQVVSIKCMKNRYERILLNFL